MRTEFTDLDKVKLFNIVDMGLSFSAMIRLYEKKSKRKIRDNILKTLDKISSTDFEDQFEKYHECFCNWGIQNVVLAERVRNNRIIKQSGPASYGQIAKTLNVVLKVVVHYCYWPNQKKSKELSKWLHAAIDNKMMRLLKNAYPDYFSRWPISVEAVDKKIYKKLQLLVKIFIKEKHDGKILPVNFDDIYWNILNRQKELNSVSPVNQIDKTERLATLFRRRSSYTRGGPNKRISFKWWFDADRNVLMIMNENGRVDQFQLDEIVKILQRIKTEFGREYFPLGNNVEKLRKDTEVRGLGTVILDFTPGNLTHAQASSYLGPVFEKIGYFEWNGKNKGIKWKLVNDDISTDKILEHIKGRT